MQKPAKRSAFYELARSERLSPRDCHKKRLNGWCESYHVYYNLSFGYSLAVDYAVGDLEDTLRKLNLIRSGIPALVNRYTKTLI